MIDYEEQAIAVVEKIAHPFWRTAIDAELNGELDSYKASAWSAAFFALRGAKDTLYHLAYWQVADQKLYLHLVEYLNALMDVARVHLYNDF